MSEEMKIDKSEISLRSVLIIGSVLIGFIAWFYAQVVIPLGQLQVAVAQVQNTLVQSTAQYQALESRVTILETKADFRK